MLIFRKGIICMSKTTKGLSLMNESLEKEMDKMMKLEK